LKRTLRMSIEDALDRAGREIQATYKQDPIPRQALVAAAANYAGCAVSSVIPSDFAYNRVNRDPVSRAHPMFLRVSRALYTYVGLDYQTGEIVWKHAGKMERVVGRSDDGTAIFEYYPRL